MGNVPVVLSVGTNGGKVNYIGPAPQTVVGVLKYVEQEVNSKINKTDFKQKLTNTTTVNGYTFTQDQINSLIPIYLWQYPGGSVCLSQSNTAHVQYGWSLVSANPVCFAYNKQVKDSKPLYTIHFIKMPIYYYNSYGPDPSIGLVQEGIICYEPTAGPVRRRIWSY